MPNMYVKVDFSMEYVDERRNSQELVLAGFNSKMPASNISIGRGNVSFKLESDSLVSGATSLNFSGPSERGSCYILDCCGVYKCAVKADYLDDFLNNAIPAELGTIMLNDPDSGDRIDLLPGNIIKGVVLHEEQGPWGRMGAVITRQHLNIEIIASKLKPKT